MKIIIKRVGGDVETITKEYLVYVTSDTEQSIKAEVCNFDELHKIVDNFKSEYNITETIYFDL
jgi:ABC-type sulfate transport system substrate-binding protein